MIPYNSNTDLSPEEQAEVAEQLFGGAGGADTKNPLAQVRDYQTSSVAGEVDKYREATGPLYPGEKYEAPASKDVTGVLQTPGDLLTLPLLLTGGGPATTLGKTALGALKRTGASVAGQTAGALLEGDSTGEAIEQGLGESVYIAALEALGLAPQAAKQVLSHMGLSKKVSLADAARVGAVAQQSVPGVVSAQSPLANTGKPVDLLELVQDRGVTRLRQSYETGEELIKTGVKSSPMYAQTRPIKVSPGMSPVPGAVTSTGIDAPTIAAFRGKEGPVDIDDAFRVVKELGDMHYGKISLPEHLTAKGHSGRQMYEDAKSELGEAIRQADPRLHQLYGALNDQYGKGRTALSLMRGGDEDVALQTLTSSAKYDITKGQEYGVSQLGEVRQKGLDQLLSAINRGAPGQRDKMWTVPAIRALIPSTGTATQTPPVFWRNFAGGNPYQAGSLLTPDQMMGLDALITQLTGGRSE